MFLEILAPAAFSALCLGGTITACCLRHRIRRIEESIMLLQAPQPRVLAPPPPYYPPPPPVVWIPGARAQPLPSAPPAEYPRHI